MPETTEAGPVRARSVLTALLLAGALGLAGAAAPVLADSASEAEDLAEYEGLPPGEGRDMVFAVCGGCHSNRLVSQQGLSRDDWDELLDWMAEEQGMAELDDETRGVILDYLATNLNTDHRPAHLQD
jgi:cytochrome c